MRTTAVALVSVLGVAALVVALCALAQPLPEKFDPARDARAGRRSRGRRSRGRRASACIVDVGGEWCAWCHIMDRFIAANADVRDR